MNKLNNNNVSKACVVGFFKLHMHEIDCVVFYEYDFLKQLLAFICVNILITKAFAYLSALCFVRIIWVGRRKQLESVQSNWIFSESQQHIWNAVFKRIDWVTI